MQRGSMASRSAFQEALCATDASDEVHDASIGTYKSLSPQCFTVLRSI